MMKFWASLVMVKASTCGPVVRTTPIVTVGLTATTCPVVGTGGQRTLLAASREPISRLSSSLSNSRSTLRRTRFSLRSRLRLSRGVCRDDILSLDRAN